MCSMNVNLGVPCAEGYVFYEHHVLRNLSFSCTTFLNSITKQAMRQDVKIEYIENHYIDSNGSFGHILEISVGCEGEYKNIAKFINQLEKNVLVTDIYGSDIFLEENSTTTLADIKISVWGINH